MLLGFFVPGVHSAAISKALLQHTTSRAQERVIVLTGENSQLKTLKVLVRCGEKLTKLNMLQYYKVFPRWTIVLHIK